MTFPVPKEKFSRFLVDAKIATYAAQDDSAKVKPALQGSHQLEFRQGGLLYRDIYYGGNYFVGQETVYFNQNPIWAMSYAGGINEGITVAREIAGIYSFLQAALRAVPVEAPYRGPESFKDKKFIYSNRILGKIHRFSGVEMIYFQENPIYQLHYSGGTIKD
jgi:hypothetical protein